MIAFINKLNRDGLNTPPCLTPLPTCMNFEVYEGDNSPYRTVCRVRLSRNRSLAAGCSSSQLPEWAQCAQDQENMEPTLGGSECTYGWPENRGSRLTWVVSHVMSFESLEFTSDMESMNSLVTHIVCSEQCTITIIIINYTCSVWSTSCMATMPWYRVDICCPCTFFRVNVNHLFAACRVFLERPWRHLHDGDGMTPSQISTRIEKKI